MVNDMTNDRLFGLAVAAIFMSALLLNALSY
jgi:hypothetical protein